MSFPKRPDSVSIARMLSAACLSLFACAGDEPGAITAPGTSNDAGVAADANVPVVPFVPVCEDDNRFCTPPDQTPPDDNTCGSKAISLSPSGVNIMLSIDGSYAMHNHWDVVQTAVKSLIENNPTLNFGAHLFWASPTSFDEVTMKLNICGNTENRVLDVGADQQTAVLPFLGPRPPGPGNNWFSSRPVIEPINYFLQNDTALSNPNMTNYLVVVSNGNDNCFGTVFAGAGDKLLTYEKLGIELVKKNIRVMPIGFDGATAQRTFGGGMLRTNFSALDKLAEFGGTGLKKALAADSAEELAIAINQVSQAVRSCRFTVPDVLDPSKQLNPFQLVFTVNGVAVARDRTEADGWNFVKGQTSEIEIFGDACTAIQAGRSVEARLGCNNDEVCGSAATRVETKARAVQYLFDRSLSMAGCSDPGAFACILNGKLSWWGLATRSIGKSVVSTINDDAEFGLMYFPGATLDSCEVAPEPEIPPGPSTEISIIGSMLANLPLGSTPLVQGLEQVASAPGRIGEDGVTGAVIVLSDGGNSCGDVTTDEAVARLGAAAKALNDRGIKVYAIRFGPKDATFADQDAQLRAIVTSGGTATGDPADPNNVPYLDAPDEDTLNAVLHGVSEALASCTLELGETPADADKSKVNLYINGTVVPFDQAGSKVDGWGWTDPAQTVIEMFGPACTEYKNSRATSLVVEFGCIPVVLG